MNKYIRDIILIILYGFFVISQLSCGAFIIDKKEYLENILYNYKNISECKNDAIYRLNNGALINNSLAILISSSIIIGTFLLLVINDYLNKYYDKLSRNEYTSLDDTNKESIITKQLMPRDKYDLAIHIIFICSIICFIVCNGIQFVLQLNNIDDNCLKYINDRIDNFYGIYKYMLTISFFASYGLLFIIPMFL